MSLTTPFGTLKVQASSYDQGFLFVPMSPMLALLHWPDFGGTTTNSLDFDTFGEISPKKKALLMISSFDMSH